MLVLIYVGVVGVYGCEVGVEIVCGMFGEVFVGVFDGVDVVWLEIVEVCV